MTLLTLGFPKLLRSHSAFLSGRGLLALGCILCKGPHVTKSGGCCLVGIFLTEVQWVQFPAALRREPAIIKRHSGVLHT